MITLPGQLFRAMIKTVALTKAFGLRTALSRVTLQVAAGEFVALVGPNGAGKTTLLRLLATLSRPTSGTLTIAGLDPAKAGEAIRRQIGFLSHRTLLYDDLTAEQNLRFYARLYEVPAAPTRIAALLEQVNLTARRHDLVRTYSRGMQQRLALARAVLHRPALLLLDEPYTGLDPQATTTLTALLRELAGEGCTIVMTSHDLAQGLALARRVIALRQGQVVLDAPTATTSAAQLAALF